MCDKRSTNHRSINQSMNQPVKHMAVSPRGGFKAPAARGLFGFTDLRSSVFSSREGGYVLLWRELNPQCSTVASPAEPLGGHALMSTTSRKRWRHQARMHMYSYFKQVSRRKHQYGDRQAMALIPLSPLDRMDMLSTYEASVDVIKTVSSQDMISLADIPFADGPMDGKHTGGGSSDDTLQRRLPPLVMPGAVSGGRITRGGKEEKDQSSSLDEAGGTPHVSTKPFHGGDTRCKRMILPNLGVISVHSFPGTNSSKWRRYKESLERYIFYIKVANMRPSATVVGHAFAGFVMAMSRIFVAKRMQIVTQLADVHESKWYPNSSSALAINKGAKIRVASNIRFIAPVYYFEHVCE